MNQYSDSGTKNHVLEVANQIGGFIEYWGFKKIHGKIWTLIFLADRPVNAGYLIAELEVSKSLVSMSLKDLIEYKVVFESMSNQSTVHYEVNPKILEVILDVLVGREAKMLQSIKGSCELLTCLDEEKIHPLASPRKAQALFQMVSSADRLFKALITLKQFNFKNLISNFNFENNQKHQKI